MRRPAVGIGVQAVVDVDRAQVVVLLPEQMQQHGGIQPAAEANEHGRVLRCFGQLHAASVGRRCAVAKPASDTIGCGSPIE